MTRPALTRQLVLEGRVQVSDGLGGFAESWQELGRLWAEVKPGQGRNVAGEETLLSSVPLMITVRGAPVGAASRPTPDQRFRDGDRLFRILAVTERDAAGRYLTCFAREEGPA